MEPESPSANCPGRPCSWWPCWTQKARGQPLTEMPQKVSQHARAGQGRARKAWCAPGSAFLCNSAYFLDAQIGNGAVFEVYVKVTKCCVQGKSRGHMLRGGQRALPGPSRAHPAVGGMGRAIGGLTLVGCFQQHPPDLGREEREAVCWRSSGVVATGGGSPDSLGTRKPLLSLPRGCGPGA